MRRLRRRHIHGVLVVLAAMGLTQPITVVGQSGDRPPATIAASTSASLVALPTAAPLPTLPPLSSIAPLPSVGLPTLPPLTPPPLPTVNLWPTATPAPSTVRDPSPTHSASSSGISVAPSASASPSGLDRQTPTPAAEPTGPPGIDGTDSGFGSGEQRLFEGVSDGASRTAPGLARPSSLPERDHRASWFGPDPDALVVGGIVLGVVGGTIGVVHLLALSAGAMGTAFAGCAAAMDRRARRISQRASVLVRPVRRWRAPTTAGGSDPIVAAVERQARAAMSSRGAQPTDP